MRVKESVHIDRPAEDVFAFLEVRANDVAWMAAVEPSEWLDPTDPPGVGRRGRMVLRIGRRRHAFVDEVTDYQPGRRIAMLDQYRDFGAARTVWDAAARAYDGLLALKPNQRPFVLTRASFAGGQRYAATWTGDNSADWTQQGLSTRML